MVLDMVSKQLKYVGKTIKCLLVPRQENHRMENFHLTEKWEMAGTGKATGKGRESQRISVPLTPLL